MRYGGVVALALVCTLVAACPGSSTYTDTDTDRDTEAEADAGTDAAVGTYVRPTITWIYQPEVRTPVTDLADCIESVLACVTGGTALGDCFDGPVSVCAGEEPVAGCCTQACGDQLAQELAGGATEHEAFLEVFAYDRTCMPGIAEEVDP